MSKIKPTNAELRKFIIEHFNDDELETFCFDYFPEVKYTRGMTFSQKVEMLIGYCQRRDLEANLLANLAQERPVAYRAQFVPPIAATPVAQTRQRNPRQVFISHAHEDAELAGRLANDLKAEGYPVWIAPNSIQPGEKWAAAIGRGLDESGTFVLLLTPAAIKSRWVRSETDAAIELEHENVMRFIPLDVESADVPVLWRTYQRIFFQNEYKNGLEELLRTLQPKMRLLERLPQREKASARRGQKQDQRDAFSQTPRRIPIWGWIGGVVAVALGLLGISQLMIGDGDNATITPTETLPAVSQITPETPSATPRPTNTRPPTNTPTPTLGIGSTRIRPKDEAVMVYVPEGNFMMGSDDG
ncbi:MAG: TIR domain-containing protein, partial [Chloroflexi bacterium]|nr:TIR domain-containing protein [Chloroflexota bacterium]